MARTTNPARSWDERDVRGTELRALSMHFGLESARFEVLLGPLLALECTRLQIQPLLEQAWIRLQALRESIVGVQAQITDAGIASKVQQVQSELMDPATTSLVSVNQTLEEAFQAACDDANVTLDAVSIRAAQSSVAAISFDFSQATVLAQEAARLAVAHDEACWVCRVQQAEFLLDQGREFNDAQALEALRELCAETLLPLAAANRDAADHAWAYDTLGQALGMLGRSQSFTGTLDESVQAFEAALKLRDQTQQPYDWAATQNHLGNAIGSLGQRQHDLELLDRSVVAFGAALEVPVSNTAPEGRASAQSNLAAVLQTIGQQRKDAVTLERAIAAYKSALSIWTPDRKPLFWAATQSNMGAALRVLGAMREDAALLEQSVAVYRAALTARTRERMPEEWARTQNDLGAALQALAELTDDAFLFGQAIAAYRDALREVSADGEPMTWAMRTANLGVARRKLAEYRLDIDLSRRAIADIRMALDVFRGACHAELTSLGLEQLAIAMEVNTELEADIQD